MVSLAPASVRSPSSTGSPTTWLVASHRLALTKLRACPDGIHDVPRVQKSLIALTMRGNSRLVGRLVLSVLKVQDHSSTAPAVAYTAPPNWYLMWGT